MSTLLPVNLLEGEVTKAATFDRLTLIHNVKAQGCRNVSSRCNMSQPSFNDVTFCFESASGLPKMDVVGSGDPYFVARLDGKVEYM